MRILFDTHCWLWWLADDPRLEREARELITDRRNLLYLSAASSLEIAIKLSLGKLRLPEPPADYVPGRLAAEGMTALPIHHAHALHVATLPHHHRDPFDRLLIAQAQIERLPILTADEQLKAYDVEILWGRV